MEEFTAGYLRKALFERGEVELAPSPTYSDVDVNWDDPVYATLPREYEPNAGWCWDGPADAEGITWGRVCRVDGAHRAITAFLTGGAVPVAPAVSVSLRAMSHSIPRR